MVTSRSSFKTYLEPEPVLLSQLGRRFFEPGATNDADIEIKTVTGISHTVSSENVILVDDDTAGADVTITLPPANSRTKILEIKKLGSTGKVFIVADGSEVIDGVPLQVIGSQYNCITIAPGTSNWHIL